ncbi:hypothetical protein NDU88_000099 [Pleurodeles waltl]|uniref:Uncharacterized protein n=1 Tax=Pleurodeles waltl TaxID=8319 RepID=A0AAV7S6L5_PLEWA|nr:hypothetical protein NDU88_000099 [Pleurodeles waltl]
MAVAPDPSECSGLLSHLPLEALTSCAQNSNRCDRTLHGHDNGAAVAAVTKWPGGTKEHPAEQSGRLKEPRPGDAVEHLVCTDPTNRKVTGSVDGPGGSDRPAQWTS